jgi:hypothetical protein
MFEEQIDAGAKWLDENDPGWELKIDLSEFDIASCHHCVLGQLYGDWMEAITEVGGEQKLIWSASHGFNLSIVDQEHEEKYDLLEQGWIQLIKDRLDQGIIV